MQEMTHRGVICSGGTSSEPRKASVARCQISDVLFQGRHLSLQLSRFVVHLLFPRLQHPNNATLLTLSIFR